MDIVYTDFKKAFDTVCHQRPLKKLHGYELGPKVTKWIGKKGFCVGGNNVYQSMESCPNGLMLSMESYEDQCIIHCASGLQGVRKVLALFYISETNVTGSNFINNRVKQ